MYVLRWRRERLLLTEAEGEQGGGRHSLTYADLCSVARSTVPHISFRCWGAVGKRQIGKATLNAVSPCIHFLILFILYSQLQANAGAVQCKGLHKEVHAGAAER